ncbi:TIGR03943 family protein [Oscillatoriales cyanobacterium USR001]|nr:TIGR03943 family protein [Oscillatoriales cyanobacterium USR001]
MIRFSTPLLLLRYSHWLDAIAILAWGILLLKYWITGKLNILIHPNYFGLTLAAGIALIAIGSLKIYELYQIEQQRKTVRQLQVIEATKIDPAQHITLFPPAWSSILLSIVAAIGLIITPKTFSSQTALERGITESLPLTRMQPQEFRNIAKPEQRSLIEWVRILNFNPEPDSYNGQKVKVQGFVIHPPSLSTEYIWIARFVITCCAADAYPIGLPVKLQLGQNRAIFPADSWLEIEGEMITEELQGKRKLVINSSSLKPIPEPKNPYNY